MPHRPALPCSQPGCPALQPCPTHRRDPYRTDQTEGRSTSERGYGWAWQQLRALVLAEEPTCRLCPAASTDVDHIMPKARGGTDNRINLRALCGDCHHRVTGRGSKNSSSASPPDRSEERRVGEEG